jgi:hypothetical protein
MKTFVLWTYLWFPGIQPLVFVFDGYPSAQRCYESGRVLDSVWADSGVTHRFVCLEAK